jgi:hypothetical protein
MAATPRLLALVLVVAAAGASPCGSALAQDDAAAAAAAAAMVAAVAGGGEDASSLVRMARGVVAVQQLVDTAWRAAGTVPAPSMLYLAPAPSVSADKQGTGETLAEALASHVDALAAQVPAAAGAVVGWAGGTDDSTVPASPRRRAAAAAASIGAGLLLIVAGHRLLALCTRAPHAHTNRETHTRARAPV